ncbi:MAG: hypothetical protein ACTTGJ_01995 [Clostridium sp.]
MPKKKINIDKLVEEELNNEEQNIKTVELNPIKPESDLKTQKFNRNIKDVGNIKEIEKTEKTNNVEKTKKITKNSNILETKKSEKKDIKETIKNRKRKSLKKDTDTNELFKLDFSEEIELEEKTKATEKQKEQEEKEFELAKKEYSKRFKLDRKVKENLIKKVLFELKIPIILILIFVATFILKNILNIMFMQIIIILLGVLSIYLYEKSFKQSSIIYFVRGLELNALTYIYILYVNQINIIYNKNISNNIMIKKVYLNKNIVLTYALIIAMYYIAKCIYMYYYTKKEYIETFNDIKEITTKKRKINRD